MLSAMHRPRIILFQSSRPRIISFQSHRPRIKQFWYRPDWEGLYKNYASKQIVNNLWKYSNIGYGVDDLVQEAWVVFERCKTKYQVFEARHFMALYKRSLHSRLYDLAIKSSQENNFVRATESIEEYLIEKSVYSYNDGPLRVLLKKAPKEVQDVMKFVLDSPTEFLEGFLSRSKNLLSNQELCKFLGYDCQKINLIKIFKDYFRSPSEDTYI